jgi:hypothetical protein
MILACEDAQTPWRNTKKLSKLHRVQVQKFPAIRHQKQRDLRGKLLRQHCSKRIYNHELQPGQLTHREKGRVIKARVWKKKTLCALATTGQHPTKEKKKKTTDTRKQTREAPDYLTWHT